MHKNLVYCTNKMVYIICIGGDEDIAKEIELMVKKNRSDIVMERVSYPPNHEKAACLYIELKKCYEKKEPVIVIITFSFLNTIWETSFKSYILKYLTRYSSNNCLHIWIDVDERSMKSFSTAMCRTDGEFRRVKYSELKSIRDEEMVECIINLLYKTEGKVCYSNLCVQQEETKLEKIISNDTKKLAVESGVDNLIIKTEQHDEVIIKHSEKRRKSKNNCNNTKKSNKNKIRPKTEIQRNKCNVLLDNTAILLVLAN